MSIRSKNRYQAVQESINRLPREIAMPQNDLGRTLPVSHYFGASTFGVKQIEEHLEGDNLKNFQERIAEGKPLGKELADKVATIIVAWALERGITHFCHWFQPMTGSTAEKHDSFLAFDKDGLAIEKFSGNQLTQSEPDASSFPSGGMRSTFEARGYTAWDPSSPMFVVESLNGSTLCIPSAFISYHGNALDEKTPLLRSMEALNKVACETMELLDEKCERVIPTLGAEQEYFLIDKSFYSLRPDLALTGRTLIGARPPKGQELNDHYFGSIPSRVAAFMAELDHELYKKGVPSKTRHNEVAPSQFELAPIFEDANISVDHNHLTMDILKKVANRHKMALLLHEKPFAGMNGNGKHNNWSLSTNDGKNLLEPGKTPQKNLRFLVMLTAVLKAVYKHNALLRASTASAGNDHRLGANEAPPAIVSVFLGEELTRILDKIKAGEEIQDTERSLIDMGLANVAHVAKDNTDRNRTSPLAFTGNKFEYRAVGSASSCSFPVTCLNAAMTDVLQEINVKLKDKLANNNDKAAAILELIRENIIESEKVRFEGNGYGEEWLREAESRGLPHLKNTPAALKALDYPEVKSLFGDLKILNESELTSRRNVHFDNYVSKIEIEVEAMMMLLDVYVIPAASSYAGDMSQTALQIKEAGGSSKTQTKIVKDISKLIDTLSAKRDELSREFQSIKTEDLAERATDLADKVLPKLYEARDISDELECLVSDNYWPLPKYREMLYIN